MLADEIIAKKKKKNKQKQRPKKMVVVMMNIMNTVILMVIKCSCWWRCVWLQYWMMIPGQEQHEADMHV